MGTLRNLLMGYSDVVALAEEESWALLTKPAQLLFSWY